MKKRFLAMIMAVVMAMSLLPVSALAAPGGQGSDQTRSVAVEQGSSGTVIFNGADLSKASWTIKGSTSTEVTGITTSVSNSNKDKVTVSVADAVSAGKYTLTYTSGSGQSTKKYTINLTVIAASSDSGSTIAPGNRYYHLDMRVAAQVQVVVYDEDGSTSTQTVSATLSNPSAKIYNTGSKTWTSNNSSIQTDSDTGLKYWTIVFNTTVSSGENEYMQDSSGRQTTEFYNGDTMILNFTLTYTLDDKQHTLPVEMTKVINEADNNCNHKDSSGRDRGFDFEASVEDVTTAASSSQLSIQKQWIDNNDSASIRPDSITVKVYQTLNNEKNHYMTLTLNNDDEESNFEMATGVTADEDMNVAFEDNYGVSITGLPQNYWVNNNGTYSYKSCSYSVEEVQVSGGTGGYFSPVYGSVVYLDDTQTTTYAVTITNTLAYEKLAVKKTWSDGDEQHTNDSVSVKLTAYYTKDGASTEVPDAWLTSFIDSDSTTVALSSSNNWYAVFGNMPVYYTTDDSSYRITGFEVTEPNVPDGYNATCSAISNEKDANGNYVVTVTNTKKPTEPEPPATGTLTVTKTVSGLDAGDSLSSNFSISVKKSDANAYADADYTLTIGGTQKTNVSYTAPNDSANYHSWTISNVPVDTYTVSENNAAVDGYSLSASYKVDNEEATTDPASVTVGTNTPTVAITNTYSKDVGALTITKRFVGDNDSNSIKNSFDGTEKKITFTISKDGQTVKTVYLPVVTGEGDDKTVSWSVTETGLALGTYTVTESGADVNGYTCTTKYMVSTVETQSVTVTKDGTATMTVTNTYTAVPPTSATIGTTDLTVKKVLTGRDWLDSDEFTFTLTAVKNAAGDSDSVTTPMPETSSVTIKGTDENKVAAFGDIEFTEEGTYKYTVSEVKGDISKVTYDTTKYTVTVTVRDNKEGALVVEDVTYTSSNNKEFSYTTSGAMTFENTYSSGSTSTGGGGSHKPTLNTKDHYGYIIGYPVDYETGEKTDDQTRMPVKPQGNITRAEVATIFFRMLTDESRNEFWSTTSGYSDVSEGQWFNNAISTLANAGILSGYPDGTFRPNAPITRAEFTKIAASFFEKLDYTQANPFNDVDEDDWFYAFVMAAYEGGLITGYPEGDFRPTANITRAEAVTIVNRTLDRHPDQDHFLADMLVWVDNMDTTKWYYADMQEATNSHEYVMKGSGDSQYENWTKMLDIRDWAAFEKEWSDANSAAGGEVAK